MFTCDDSNQLIFDFERLFKSWKKIPSWSSSRDERTLNDERQNIRKNTEWHIIDLWICRAKWIAYVNLISTFVSEISHTENFTNLLFHLDLFFWGFSLHFALKQMKTLRKFILVVTLKSDIPRELERVGTCVPSSAFSTCRKYV